MCSAGQDTREPPKSSSQQLGRNQTSWCAGSVRKESLNKSSSLSKIISIKATPTMLLFSHSGHHSVRWDNWPEIKLNKFLQWHWTRTVQMWYKNFLVEIQIWPTVPPQLCLNNQELMGKLKWNRKEDTFARFILVLHPTSPLCECHTF